MSEPITYWYSVRSSFTYLGAERLYQMADWAGREIIHRPLLLSIVVPATGGIFFTERHEARLKNSAEDQARWSEVLGIPILPDPVHHYGGMELPSGLVVTAQEEGLNVNQLSFEILAALWRDDRDICDPAVTDELCAKCGIDGPALREKALLPETWAKVNQNSADAVEKLVIGSPTYEVDGELYYGQDRLIFVERALGL